MRNENGKVKVCECNRCKPLHCKGRALMLHACENERARVRGSWRNGALAESRKQAQLELVFMKDLSESQHVLGGFKPLLLVLPVMTLAHGVKLFIIEVVQEVLTCPVTEFTELTARAVRITPI